MVDFRRGRLLKKLVRIARGPSLMYPLERLRKHSAAVLLAAVAIHVIVFAVLYTLLTDEHE
jgi:hypothetical protein